MNTCWKQECPECQNGIKPQKKVVAQDGLKKFSGHKRNTSYLAICVYKPIFTEYSRTGEPVHNEHRCKEIMATVSK